MRMLLESSEIEKFQPVKTKAAIFFRRRRLGVAPEVRPGNVPFEDTSFLPSSSLVPDISASL